jgi:hypothetical protein
MLETLNATVCVILMVLLAPVAITMNHAGHWPQRLAFIVVALIFSLQVVQPLFTEWLAAPTWLQTAFNVVVMLVVLSARREIMAVVRLSVGKRPPEMEGHPLRRADDMPADFLSQVHGRGNP